MVALGEKTPQLHILFSQAHYEKGDVEKRSRSCGPPLRWIVKSASPIFYSGLIYLKAGKFADAAREFENELALNPKTWKQNIIWLTLCWPSSRRTAV